jgi:hypothetical protein
MSFTRNPARIVRTAALLAALCAGLVTTAHAVTVSPTALFLDSRNPGGTLTLYNGGTLPEEVEISFSFGYPVTDANGNVTVQFRDTAAAGEPSLVPWLRAFPRRLQLAPGQQQTIRVMASPPAELAGGEYWGRVMVRARGGQPPIEQTTGNVRVALDVETEVATAVLFRKGEVTTGATVRSATARPLAGRVDVLLDLERTGNAAFLGRVQARVVGPDGRVLGQVEDAVALYRQLRWRLSIPAPAAGFPAGSTVQYTVDTERPDLPRGALAAAPVTGSVPLR